MNKNPKTVGNYRFYLYYRKVYAFHPCGKIVDYNLKEFLHLKLGLRLDL